MKIMLPAILFSMLTATSILFSSCCTSNDGSNSCTDSTKIASENVVIETIMARRSIRKYKDIPVEREKLEAIATCGINAPSGMNMQPWQIRIVDNAEYINGITELFKTSNPEMAKQEEGFKNIFRNAPAVIFIASPSNGNGQLDCGLLGENIILAAQSMGLGTCCLGGPIHFMKSNPKASQYIDRLNIPEDYSLLYAIGVGYPDESPEAKPRDASKVQFVD